ncbi:hypothetical protein K501DRAFT_329713 [Backusella circina FSU 941]|nr:hypothetical protein K501DRAFT_329713 [Backusella circina FSU 941]
MNLHYAKFLIVPFFWMFLNRRLEKTSRLLIRKVKNYVTLCQGTKQTLRLSQTLKNQGISFIREKIESLERQPLRGDGIQEHESRPGSWFKTLALWPSQSRIRFYRWVTSRTSIHQLF